MNNVHILDCTLRDGGYCNNWEFGFDNTKKIISGLIEAGIEIIECGFLTNKIVYDRNVTKYTTLDELTHIIPERRDGRLFVAMMNYGEYNVEDLPDYDGSSIDGIRVAFHKKDCKEALELCCEIKKKGYLVFVQAMVSLSYTDEEFLAVIKNVNQFKPYAFYIVDSFGMMKGKDLTRLFYMIEHNLEKDIHIGFHSHNNMQLAYSNAQKLTTVQTNRSLIIDSSVYGMGRGAGNLNTELFVEYLNENTGKNYQLKPLLFIIDEILNGFYQKNYWGYSLPNYISAVHNAHPNYASYLSDKNTLTIEAMNEIFEMMDEEKKISYDKRYIENLYYRYMETGKIQEEHMEELRKYLSDKKILLIAPGKSSVDELEKIKEFVIKKEVVIISVNFEYFHLDVDYVFLSNLRRFHELPKLSRSKCIVTSNIPATDVYLRTSYKKLLSEREAVRDNAGLMAIKFLADMNVSEIFLAGFDGYSHNENENYGDHSMEIITKFALLDTMNTQMREELSQLVKEVKISFLTTPRWVQIDR